MRATAGPCANWPGDPDFIRELMERTGDKWTMLVVATLSDGPLRYTELQHSVPGISQRMLTLTLRQLTRDGLITRTSYPEVPPRVEYALTPLGRSLLGAVLAMAAWSVENHEEVRANRERYDLLESG
ncbi:winged helix-turn-helix transcriptional regulator [Kribbella sp. NPDC056951]|uniref:winged helix-turn-helix transcriptional regulator n=1 Tax=Kribbella sp. NPDC056951 TaxID=3345978 RepID=UPI003637D231